ncbi:mannobiose 2-epimerase [Gracilibacillus halotolerans]|uniref:Cellobiose 2-epimerase n=1 Tax=Gracilibacillus halotolerans TaxID=74386 RepID=A0A841RJ07_9BACI|nr:AGE family epimerase/isomerase [Gracilibacillus halotolerans]MBB6514220.1 mannobiose 2-epimerase [Gracilibacillus halotolerans]
MQLLAEEIKEHLELKILPFWMRLKDEENGGFYGEIDYDLSINKFADKGGIAIARFLWTFSSAYRVLRKETYLKVADSLYDFLKKHLLDQEYGGMYWMVDYRGNPKDQRKHIYAQSFALYALSEYYRVTQSEEVLQIALEIYDLIERKGYNEDSDGYFEEFDRHWNLVPNEMLSEHGVIADMTMNTHIHILEAYTNFYKAYPNEEIQLRLENLLEIHYEKIYQPSTKFLHVFFDDEWKSLVDMKSFGHDIEASWLIDKALDAISLKHPKYDAMVIDIAYNIANCAVDEDGSVINEELAGRIDKTKVWWVQAEAMVGFLNAYERTGDARFVDSIKELWNYIQNYVVDTREHGEWFWSVDDKGVPMKRAIGEPWKTSYHNGRFCLEFIERVLQK